MEHRDERKRSGQGDMAFPSAVRSVESKPSQLVGMDEALKPTEKNGFARHRCDARQAGVHRSFM